MIFGIGTDIVSVGRMHSALARHGERFARRILADRELTEYFQVTRPEHFLAKRFAAKEAAAKALGTGFSGGLSLRHIALDHDHRGKPLLVFLDYALELIQNFGVGEAFISVSDEREHAVAFVTLLRRPA